MYLRFAWEFLKGLFVRKAPLHAKSFGVLAVDQKNQEFLLDAKRPDWGENEALEAKEFITNCLNTFDLETLLNLPKCYFYLIDDVKLNLLKISLDQLASKLNDEKIRRGV